MNKVTKGSLAAAAAGALLLGGVGTYATWSDSENVNAGTVATGQLNFTAGTPAGWIYEGETEVTTSPVMVAGETITNTYTVTVNAEGDHIAGQFTISNFDDSAFTDVTVDASPVNLPTGVTEDATTGVLSFNGEDADGVYSFDVNLTVNAGADAEQAQSLDLSALGLSLEQVAYVAPTAEPIAGP